MSQETDIIDDDVESIADPTEDDMGDPSVEERARLQGWVPENEWKGPKGKWIPADEFIDRGEKSNRILRERLETLERELYGTRQTIANMERVNKSMADRAYQQAITDLKAARDHAARNFENDKAFAYQEQIDEIQQERQVQAQQPQQQVPLDVQQETQAWFDGEDDTGIARKAWYNRDPILTAEMNAAMSVMWQNYPQIPHSQRLLLAEESVKRRYPAQFRQENPMRQQAGARAGNGSTAPRKGNGKKSYADLPAAAKKACDAFVADKRFGMTREQYVEEYFNNA